MIVTINLIVAFFQVSKITDSNGENVVLMLGRCLPHIVPNVLLAKREVKDKNSSYPYVTYM